jgi:hypothetical protein
MVFHKGDTLFLSAQADISVGKVLTKRFGRINACGFNIPEKDRPWGYDTYTNSQNYKNQNDKKLEHHGALLVYQMNGNNVLSVAEYCSLPVDPNDKTQKDATLKRKMLIFTQDNVEIVFGLNDKDVSNEEGFAKVSMDSHLKNTPGLVKQ